VNKARTNKALENLANEELEKIALASLFDRANNKAPPPLDLFFFSTSRTIYAGFEELEARNIPPDLITLTNLLRETGQLEAVGGAYAITRLWTDYIKPELTQYALGDLRELRANRWMQELQKQMGNGDIGPEAARDRLDAIINSIDPLTGLCVRPAREILDIKLDANDCLWGDRLLAKSGQLVIAGQPGIGKSHFLLQLAAACISGKPCCGIETHARGLPWLILQTENSNRRLQFDLHALTREFGSEFLAQLFIRTLEGEELLSLSNPAAIDAIIRKVRPGIIAWDPLRDVQIGDPNSDRDMQETVRAMGRICRRGDQARAIVVLHHALTGRAGVAKFMGWDRASYARNSKLLLSWTRAQINLAPGSSEDNDTLVVGCAKNNDGKEFAPFAVRLNPESMIYEPDDSFDLQGWKEELGGQAGKISVKPQILRELLERGRDYERQTIVALIKEETGVQNSRAYQVVRQGKARGILRFNKLLKTYALA
jgi:AAA domain-containing protein/DnaB helicase-like protein